MIRRTQTIYINLDPFLSLRGAVLHHFDQFLAGLEEVQFPCIWLTSMTRAQLDEPRRRLGHNDPFIGESGCGVYLPEDYFHLKSGKTIRLGRFTCIPIAKPQPAAAEALEELSNDLGISAVSLRSLSPRELSQNAGLPGSEAEQIRRSQSRRSVARAWRQVCGRNASDRGRSRLWNFQDRRRHGHRD